MVSRLKYIKPLHGCNKTINNRTLKYIKQLHGCNKTINNRTFKPSCLFFKIYEINLYQTFELLLNFKQQNHFFKNYFLSFSNLVFTVKTTIKSKEEKKIQMING